MERPWLVQRCLLTNWLVYDYMGSTEYHEGEQAKSLRRILSAGMQQATVRVMLEGNSIPVYLVAITGFPHADYLPYLQDLAEGTLRLQEPCYFDGVVRIAAGLPTYDSWVPRTNCWFDFENDVFWTLSEQNQKALTLVLDRLKKKAGPTLVATRT